MKLINLNQYKRERQRGQLDALARSVVQGFQRTVLDNFLLADGTQVGLLTAQRLLCQYWEFSDEPCSEDRGPIAQRYEVALLEEEERSVSLELFLARRRLALMLCPFAERDIIEHQCGLRGWVAAVDWSREGFLVQVGRLGRQERPLRGDNRIYLWGPAEAAEWIKVGELSIPKALGAGWLDRSL